jgi:hypothetical protein
VTSWPWCNGAEFSQSLLRQAVGLLGWTYTDIRISCGIRTHDPGLRAREDSTTYTSQTSWLPWPASSTLIYLCCKYNATVAAGMLTDHTIFCF